MAAKKIGGISVAIVADVQKFIKGIASARRYLAQYATQAKIAAAAMGAMFVVAVKKSLTALESLNRSMQRSTAIMGTLSDAMRKDMRQAAIEVARSTNFSASQAADAYYFLASAGLDAKQSLVALPKVAAFATAGNFDLAMATTLASDAQAALGLKVKNVPQYMHNLVRVTDVLTKANVLANASVEQFSLALTTKAGAAMRLVGMDIEEGVAVLAAFADQGVKAEDAGTAFSIVLRDMQTKALENVEAFRQNRIAVFDSRGEFRRMADIIQDIEKRLYGMSDAQKKATLLSLGFSDKSVAYTQTLIGTSEKIREYETALRAAGGTTKEVADKSLTEFEKAMNKLKASFQQLAESMAPWLEKLAKGAELMSQIVSGVDAMGARGTINLDSLQGRYKPADVAAQPVTAEQAFIQQARTFEELQAFRLRQGDYKGLFREYAGLMPFGEIKQKANPFAAGRSLVGAGVGKVQDALGIGRNLLGRIGETAGAAKDYNAAPFSALKSAVSEGMKLFSASGVARTASNFGVAGNNAFVGARDAAMRFFGFDIPQLLGQKAAMDIANGNKPGQTPALAFAQSGTADSYRQQAAIRRQSEATRLDKTRNTLLAEIRDDLRKKPGLLIARAG